jgi:hypothetical protein
MTEADARSLLRDCGGFCAIVEASVTWKLGLPAGGGRRRRAAGPSPASCRARNSGSTSSPPGDADQGSASAAASANPGALPNAPAVQDHLGAAIAVASPPRAASRAEAALSRLLGSLDHQEPAELLTGQVYQRPAASVLNDALGRVVSRQHRRAGSTHCPKQGPSECLSIQANKPGGLISSRATTCRCVVHHCLCDREE